MVSQRISPCVTLLVFAIVVASQFGCSSTVNLMPTPNVYANGERELFTDVPPELQNNKVDVLYMTDRTPEDVKAKPGSYGYRRSRSVAFGVSQVHIGKDLSWEELKKASTEAKRSKKLEVAVSGTLEIVRFPETPRVLIVNPDAVVVPSTQPTMLGDEPDAEQLAAEANVQAELAARLAKTPVKEVYLFVHGYNNNFHDSVTTIAQLWHFMGRQGVPIAYSWPAGRGGALRGYTYDRESSEFTVFHLKQMLRVIAACPDVKKVNIICHSRGTDVTVNAIRELHMEIHGSGRRTRDVMKLGAVVLAAPDIDLDVVIQKFATVRLGQVPERFVLYVCGSDQALGISTWLFGSLRRAGQLQADLFKPEELEYLRASKTTQIVDARVSNTGAFGHDYFHSNPAVSSDLILVMRYGLAPGPETGRPLKKDLKGFWVIEDDYPHHKLPATVPAAEGGK